MHDKLDKDERGLPVSRERQTRAWYLFRAIVSDEFIFGKYGDVGPGVHIVLSLTGMLPIKLKALIVRHGDSIPLFNLTGGCDALQLVSPPMLSPALAVAVVCHPTASALVFRSSLFAEAAVV